MKLDFLRSKYGFLAVIAVAFLAGALFIASSQYPIDNRSGTDHIAIRGHAVLKLYDQDGDLKNIAEKHNFLTPYGMQTILSRLVNKPILGENSVRAPIDMVVLLGRTSAASGMFIKLGDLPGQEVTFSDTCPASATANLLCSNVVLKATFGPGMGMGQIHGVALATPQGTISIDLQKKSTTLNIILLDKPIDKGEKDTLEITVVITINGKEI